MPMSHEEFVMDKTIGLFKIHSASSEGKCEHQYTCYSLHMIFKQNKLISVLRAPVNLLSSSLFKYSLHIILKLNRLIRVL